MDILLDLDGTLTDPREGITRCIQYALERLERPVPEQHRLLHCIGPPLHESFSEMLDGNDELASRAVALYRERFGEVGLYENAPYPGIAEALETLRSGRARLFVATSKPTIYARRIVVHFGLDKYLEDVFGSELDGTRTDKSELLAYVAEQLGLATETTRMIGDRKHDMIGARNNNIQPHGVTWGYGSRAELIEAGAADLLNAPMELPTVLAHDS
ncbi:HAD family hydrolase [Wenzhouxiangella sediminis]|uniref:HAD family hydrolase n=1 Tax=Wenzhouxiangella sediminis TaxID=1792836 RepID=A0A3E1KB24_9GAMM|nr:HAD family hydrolase [Wenzhouxiangella sediminis]RFF31527.1 HAD family hydrolase [Wenzhouxiangella sediminis]